MAESHANYPILIWFRSPHAMSSRVPALLAVLDSAALYVSLCPESAPVQARRALRMGFESLREIAGAPGIRYDADPRPGDPIALTEAEFHDGIGRLEAVGFPIERTPAEAWPHFAGWRVNYESIALSLIALTWAPPCRWTGERAGTGTVVATALINRTSDAREGGPPH